MIVFILVAFGLIALGEIPPLKKKKYWPELIIFLSFFTLAFIFACLLALNVPIGSPIKLVQSFFENVLKLYYR